MNTRRTAALLVLTLITVAPRLSAAMDADTARMEAANLCTAMPYTCGAVAPPVTPPTKRKISDAEAARIETANLCKTMPYTCGAGAERKAPKPPVVAQKPVMVPQDNAPHAVTAPEPPARALTHAEAATIEACAREVLRGAQFVTMQHIHDIDICVLLVSKALR